ncbi:hypothetical protein C2E25_16355 [Geothermobacter hydrogeniphilus]|uniref:Calcineurin-like phosphoesterase domain-containing protein n=1 Tax=Geothermobacter hydrogeniphilus TaxID=1969733 RepID=A0A2K2H5T9_9BACT|nr:metallophosphoesterase [Geothermobacter hydrogeniphilus]PNU18682.1 hypothetical protein C2E25_16355 [Geothermobacter hydrogeniphilus]
MSDRTVPEPAPRITRRRLLQGGLLGVGAAFVGDGMIYEPRAAQIARVRLTTDRLPPGRTLRLVQLTDLHIGSLGSYHRLIAERVRALTPDLLLLTGDYLELRRNLHEVQRFLSLLKGIAPILAVQGNWEYWARLEGENLRRKFAARGVELLINEARPVSVKGIPLNILGLDYPSGSDSLRRLLRQTDPTAFNLLLSHVPAFEHRLLDPAIDLILCGHTHGGQVRLPLLPPLYLPRYSGRFVAGLFHVGPTRTPLYVSRGLGTSILPVRIFCRPEITVVELAGKGRGPKAKG